MEIMLEKKELLSQVNRLLNCSEEERDPQIQSIGEEVIIQCIECLYSNYELYVIATEIMKERIAKDKSILRRVARMGRYARLEITRLLGDASAKENGIYTEDPEQGDDEYWHYRNGDLRLYFESGYAPKDSKSMERHIDQLEYIAENGVPNAFVRLGELHRETGSRLKAEECYRMAIDAGDPEGHLGLALLKAKNNLLEAKTNLIKAIGEGVVGAYSELVTILAEQGAIEEAATWAEAAAIDNDFNGYYALFSYYKKHKRYEEARGFLEKAAAGGLIKALCELGEIKIQNDDYLGAKADYEKVEKSGYKSAIIEAKRKLAFIYSQMGDKNRVVGLLDQVYEDEEGLDEVDELDHFIYGAALMDVERYEEAEKWLKEALEMGVGMACLCLIHLSILERSEEGDHMANIYVKKALELGLEKDLQGLMGAYLVAFGNIEEGQTFLRMAVSNGLQLTPEITEILEHGRRGNN